MLSKRTLVRDGILSKTADAHLHQRRSLPTAPFLVRSSNFRFLRTLLGQFANLQGAALNRKGARINSRRLFRELISIFSPNWTRAC